jgi:MoxR-like ATPase
MTKKTVAVPKEQIIAHVEHNKIVGQEGNIELIDLAVQMNESVLLIGETGVGKTSLVRNLAHDKGFKSVRFNLTGETTVDEFVGKYTLHNGETLWQDGVLLQAMKKGMWLICDEINAALPEILFVLHSLLDDDRHVMVANHNGEIVKPHEDFRFFATMNPVDEYAGTKELNKAFKSRFGMILIIETPDNEKEIQLIQDRTGVSVADARKIVLVANKLRDMKRKQQIFLTTSTRDLLQWAALSLKTGLGTAFGVTILNKSDNDEERKLIIEALRNLLAELHDVQHAGNTELDPNFYKKEVQKVREMAQQELEKLESKKQEMKLTEQQFNQMHNDIETFKNQVQQQEAEKVKKEMQKLEKELEKAKEEARKSSVEPQKEKGEQSEDSDSGSNSAQDGSDGDIPSETGDTMPQPAAAQPEGLEAMAMSRGAGDAPPDFEGATTEKAKGKKFDGLVLE